MSSSSPTSEPKVNAAAFQSLLATYPKDTPVYMLNLLQYLPSAIYSPPLSAETNTAACTGHEAYHDRYLPAVKPFLKEIGAEITFLGKAREGLIEGAAKWDEVMIVKYPNVEAFAGLVANEKYQKEAGVHRVAAIQGFRLVPMEV